MTSIYLGSLILKIFEKKYYQESQLYTSCETVYCWKEIHLSPLTQCHRSLRPYFDYCSEVWDLFGEIQSKRLQNRAVRIISNMSNDLDHSTALCMCLGLGATWYHQKEKARMMYKTLNKMGPESLTNLFIYKGDITNYKCSLSATTTH